MTATDPGQPHPPSASPSVPPRLDLPWMQALIAAGAVLSDSDDTNAVASAQANNAVHYIRCGNGPGDKEAGTDFLSAVSRARRLVATGARRIVFLTLEDKADCGLRQSLISFSRNAGRALPARPTEFVVVPVTAKQTD
ncbi:hypothetical protein [Pseudotabrizicola formosa]|uniref:hypothetical protein n=1 Tax=Pseudotabrizicola formosa TaxID=2030009 RepID=UPI0011AF343A|nr:hypothetical protein [Pseudotabrizicola formosa]